MRYRSARLSFLRPLTAMLALAIFFGACAPGGEPTAADVAAADLQALADEVYDRRIANSPMMQMWQGLPVETLPDISYERAEADAAFAEAVLERLAAIDTEALPHDDWITWAVLERDARMTVEGLQYYWYSNALTPYSSAIGGLRRTASSWPGNAAYISSGLRR